MPTNNQISHNQITLGVGAIVFKNDAVLLVKRKNPPNQDQWAIPGGKVKYGEALKQAVAREILEETGIIIEVKEPVYTFEIISTENDDKPALHYVVIDYQAQYRSGEILAADDAEAAAWITRSEFKTLAVNPLTQTLLQEQFNFP